MIEYQGLWLSPDCANLVDVEGRDVVGDVRDVALDFWSVDELLRDCIADVADKRERALWREYVAAVDRLVGPCDGDDDDF